MRIRSEAFLQFSLFSIIFYLLFFYNGGDVMAKDNLLLDKALFCCPHCKAVPVFAAGKARDNYLETNRAQRNLHWGQRQRGDLRRQ